MRYALKFAYDGTKFSGSQIQNHQNVTTVQGVIVECLKEHHVIKDSGSSKLQLASRTDAGVSALGNVLAFNTDFKKQDVFNILNSKLNHCWFYIVIEVDDKFNPRHTKMRWYRYHLLNKGNLDIELLLSIIKIFEGEHDLRNFANPHIEPGNTVRTLASISAFEDGAWILIDLHAPGFLWNQVRRLVSAWEKCAAGELERAKLETALNEPDNRFDLGKASAEPLFLMDIEYDLEFEIDNNMLKKTKRRLFSNLVNAKLKTKFFDELFERIE